MRVPSLIHERLANPGRGRCPFKPALFVGFDRDHHIGAMTTLERQSRAWATTRVSRVHRAMSGAKWAVQRRQLRPGFIRLYGPSVASSHDCALSRRALPIRGVEKGFGPGLERRHRELCRLRRGHHWHLLRLHHGRLIL